MYSVRIQRAIPRLTTRTVTTPNIRHPHSSRAARLPASGSASQATPGPDARWPLLGSGRTLAQAAYEVVRERIVAGELAPLTFIREEELAGAMGVSRTPVREALGRLASEGFLERVPQRGFRVPERSLDDLVHLYPVLQALELLAGDLAFPRIGPADLQRLEEANEGFARAVDSNDVVAAVELNDRFHHLLADLSGNPVLCRLLDDLRMQVRRLEVLDFSAILLGSGSGGSSPMPRDSWVKQHAAIIDALHRGEHARARDLLRENRSFVFEAKVGQVQAIQDAEGSQARSASA
jgi:DNA-binding GntR family transcriptional regulator